MEQLTVRALLAALAALPPTQLMRALCAPHPYAGCPQQVAFEVGAPSLVRDVASLVRRCVGTRLYAHSTTLTPSLDTLVWLADWGRYGAPLATLLPLLDNPHA